MNNRELLEARQVNYANAIKWTEEWSQAKNIFDKRWGYLHRLITAIVANVVPGGNWDPALNPSFKKYVTEFLDKVKVTGGAATIRQDVMDVYADTVVTQAQVDEAAKIVNNWDANYFLNQRAPIKELAAKDTNDEGFWAPIADVAAKGEKGDKGDQGPQGEQGPQGLPGPPGSGVGGAMVLSGTRNFESFGKTDDAAVQGINNYFRNNGRDTVIVPAREIRTRVQLELWSWFSMMGGVGVPSREYGRCRWRYEGTEPSIFKYVDNKGRHSYPADGSPRDGNVIGIEFVGAKDVIPRTPALTAGKVLWYWLFENVGANGVTSFHIGYGNGTQYFTGVSHAQAFTGTLLDIGGSENTWFGDKHSFIDSKALPSGAVMLRSKMDKSFIEKVMTTTRGNYIPLEIYGGHATDVNRVSFDAQDSDPTNGPALLITGGEQIHIVTNKFKGMALGGQPIIDIRGGSQIVIDNNKFVRRGASGKIGPADTPLVKVGAGVGDDQVTFGATNSRGGYSGRLVAARAAQIWNGARWAKVTQG